MVLWNPAPADRTIQDSRAFFCLPLLVVSVPKDPDLSFSGEVLIFFLANSIAAEFAGFNADSAAQVITDLGRTEISGSGYRNLRKPFEPTRPLDKAFAN